MTSVRPPGAASARVQILHLEDVDLDSELVAAQLRAAELDFELVRTETAEDFRRALEARPVDVIISDFTLPHFDGLAALALTRAVRPGTPFIFFSGTIGEERAVEALKAGADDYVLKEHPARLPNAIRAALDQRDEQNRRQLAEAKVREQAAILDRVADAIFVTDLQRRTVFWNRSAELLFGVRTEDVIGRDPAGLLQRLGIELPTIDQLIQQGGWKGDATLAFADRATVLIESRWSVLRDELGRPRSIFVQSVDVTERRQIEQRLLRAQRLESIGALAGGVAHDLNNLLSPIILSMQVLEARVVEPDLQPMLRTVATSARRGADLVRQIVSFARGAAPNWRVLDVAQFVEDAAKFLSDVLPREIKIGVSIEADLAPVTADATRIFQVVMNFAVNARDAMPQGGRIDLLAFHASLPRAAPEKLTEPLHGRFVGLSVRDTGSGIPPDVFDRIFEPFFTTKGDDHGTGLGLATAAQVARDHRGAIGVTSVAGRGSVFTIYLPLTATAEPTPPAVTPAQASILVVDDDSAVLQIVRLMLETNGYSVLTASSGVEGLGVFKQNLSRIGLVLSDLGMVGMDGPSMVRAMWELNPDLPCIGISGDMPGDNREVWGERIAALIEKPFSAADLLTVVARHFPGSSAPTASATNRAP